MKKAVFLDRDGTVIRDMVYLNDPNQIYFFDESYAALSMLHNAGYLLILVTNQSGVARGLVQIENLHKINEIVVDTYAKHNIPIAAVYYCPHPVDGGCSCRKPKPGMLLDAAKKFDIDLKNSWMVGDRLTDVDAGLAAGCRSVLLTEAHPEKMPTGAFVTVNVLEAATVILKESNPLIA